MIYSFQQMLSLRLLLWGIGSVGLGRWFLRQRESFHRAFAQQSIAWGFINASIATIGWLRAQRKAADPQNHAVHIQRQEAYKLRRLLWINSGLDVLYVLGGLHLSMANHGQQRNWRGHGWGIFIQGLFLLVFDCFHTLQLHRLIVNIKHRWTNHNQ